ncbi:MAG TPA: hypothetical protein VGL21_17210 [Jatrophihabitantaceae bacterium]
MYVEVRGTKVQVRDPDNCRALDVRVSAADRASLDTALRASGLGAWTGGPEADLNVAELRAAAARGPVGADWPQRWDAMLDYAATKDWLTADGEHVRAHLVNLD